MKIIVLFSLICYSAYSQSKGCVYKVSQIESGTVSLLDGTPLKKGDVVNSIKPEDFSFIPPNKASLILISEKCGEMRVFKPIFRNLPIITVLINYFGLNSEWRGTGTRGDYGNLDLSYSDYLAHLRYIFSGSNNPQTPNLLLILGNTAQFSIDRKFFPQNEESYFMIRYKYNDILIDKKLHYKKNDLIISYDEIFTINKKLISPDLATDMVLLYNSKSLKNPSENPKLICAFRPYFEIDNVLIDEYKKLQKANK